MIDPAIIEQMIIERKSAEDIIVALRPMVEKAIEDYDIDARFQRAIASATECYDCGMSVDEIANAFLGAIVSNA
jgi:hypothetical protein